MITTKGKILALHEQLIPRMGLFGETDLLRWHGFKFSRQPLCEHRLVMFVLGVESATPCTATYDLQGKYTKTYVNQ